MDTQQDPSCKAGKHERWIKVLVLVLFGSISMFAGGMTILMIDALHSPMWLAHIASAGVYASMVLGPVSLITITVLGFRQAGRRPK